jgi:hypothetical protein
MTKTLAEQLARFGFKSKTADAVAAPEGFDDEAPEAAPEVVETQADVVSSTEVAEATTVEASMEAEAHKAEEAPKTETVEETPKAEEAPKTEEAAPAPAQVETPVKAPEAAPVKKSPKSVSRMRIIDKDVDIDITSIGEVKPISNRGLRKFREDTFGKNPLDEVPSEYIIDGVLAKGTGIPCVWEEGGADMASGYALLIADKDGNKKAPVLCLHDKDVSNGKHALVPVAEGDLILLGVMKQLDETQMCCIIGSVTRIGDAKDERVAITVSPAVCAQATSDDPNFEVQYTDDSLSFINADHPLLGAGLTRVQEKFCHEPIYVRSYVSYKFNKIINDDLNRTFADTKFVQTLQVFNTTNEAYDELEKVIGDKVAAATKRESVLVTTVLNINKDSQGNDCVFVYIVGCVFNSAKEVCSSQGGRFFYARVKVLPGETFTYIDARDKSLTFEQALAQMTLAGKKWVADTVKRVTV